MYFVKGTPVPAVTLPPELKLTTYRHDCDEDKLAWAQICRNGLVADDAGTQAFDDRIIDTDDCVPETDCMFLDKDGEHIATITAIYHPEGNYGQVHMVAVRTDHRGEGLSKYLCAAALKKLDDAGAAYSYLTTDDWRVSAVKSYLTAGFVPVEYDEGMTERWQSLFTLLEIGKTPMVDENCEIVRYLEAAPKIRIGVFGAGRGQFVMQYCEASRDAELVAVCDGWPYALERAKKTYGEKGDVTFYSDFESFIQHDMDLVMLANFADEHAPYAIRCMEAGKNVLSEVLPVRTMKEAVELIECIERTGKRYFYAENYCYMPAPRKMRQLVRNGVLGDFEYGEGEYMHNCEPDWASLTFANPEHWRNTMSAFYYCTHSLGPLVHISGLRPVRVTGFELPHNARMHRMGARAGSVGIEMVTLENGAVLKSAHGVGPSKNSVWYSIYGSKGRMESAREDSELDGVHRLYVNCDENEGDNKSAPVVTDTSDFLTHSAEVFGHGGSDFYMVKNVVLALRGYADADVIDIFEALDYFLPGMFAYRSVLAGGVPMQIPDLRDEKQREQWRNDTQCTVRSAAGDQYVPPYSKGDPEIPAENYAKLKAAFTEKFHDDGPDFV